MSDPKGKAVCSRTEYWNGLLHLRGHVLVTVRSRAIRSWPSRDCQTHASLLNPFSSRLSTLQHGNAFLISFYEGSKAVDNFS